MLPKRGHKNKNVLAEEDGSSILNAPMKEPMAAVGYWLQDICFRSYVAN